MHSIDLITRFVEQYTVIPYFLVFFLIIVEGDFTLLVAAIMCHLGALNIWIAFPVAFLGAIGKTVSWYYLGDWLHKKFPNSVIFKYMEKKVLFLLPKFKERPFWSIFVTKFIYGINYIALIFSGYLKIRFKTYFKAEFYSSIIWVLGLMGLGYFFSYAALGISRDIKKFSIVILLFIFGYMFIEKIIAGFYEAFEEIEEIKDIKDDKKQ